MHGKNIFNCNIVNNEGVKKLMKLKNLSRELVVIKLDLILKRGRYPVRGKCQVMQGP